MTDPQMLPLTSYSGIMTSPQTICVFDIPSSSSARSILIWGTLEIEAVNNVAEIKTVDVEVLLNHPVTGELIARGGVGLQSRRRGAPLTSTVIPLPTAHIPADTQTAVYVNLVPETYPVLCEFDAADVNSSLFMVETAGT